MNDMHVPKGYQSVMPYLIIKDANGFLLFCKKVFGATEQSKVMRDENTIMHGEVAIGGSTIMFADSTEQFTPKPAGMFVYVPDADATYHQAKQAGASVVMELSDQSYGRTCGVQDPFGNVWWITSTKQPS